MLLRAGVPSRPSPRPTPPSLPAALSCPALPPGNYGGWKATAIGANHQAATNVLQGDYKEELGLEEVGGLVGLGEGENGVVRP